MPPRLTLRAFARQLRDSDSNNSDKAKGVHFAEVTDVEDPSLLGRIKVRLDYMKQDEQTGWIQPKSGFHGDGFGSTFDFPMVKDKVKIEYIMGNIHNMVWSPAAYHPRDKQHINSVGDRATPIGYKGKSKYDAREGKRLNILKTLSGWLLEMIEGRERLDENHAVIESPTGRDVIRWYAPKHKETKRSAGVMKVKIDDLAVFWDSQDGTARLKWDALYKFINLQMHESGQFVIEDHHGGSLVWDDEKKKVVFTLPSSGSLSIIDNIGGNFTYDAKKSTASFAMIGDFNITALNIRLLAAESITIVAPALCMIGAPFFGNYMLPEVATPVEITTSTPDKEV